MPTATILLDSLRFVTLSTLRNGLKAGLDDLAASGELIQPAVVLPERAVSALAPEQPATAIAYRDFDPGAPVSATGGSDAFVGMVLRDFARAGRGGAEDGWIAPDAPLEVLRAQRCRSIVIVTDYVGSGNQVRRLAEAIARNPTIRSWRSLHLITIDVLAFAASSDALVLLESSKAIDRVWSIEAAPTFDQAPWDRWIREAVVELCTTKARSKRWALGYRQTAGLFVTERGAPNNLPAVFLQDGRGWEPLFPKRTIPAAFAEQLQEYQLSETLAEVALRVGQFRFGQNQRLSYMRPESEDLLRALLLLDQGVRSSAELSAELGLKISKAETLMTALRQLALIDVDGHITTVGRRELVAQKRRLRRTTANLEGSDATYYPLSLK